LGHWHIELADPRICAVCWVNYAIYHYKFNSVNYKNNIDYYFCFYLKFWNFNVLTKQWYLIFIIKRLIFKITIKC
jgi:hypothetical protein